MSPRWILSALAVLMPLSFGGANAADKDAPGFQSLVADWYHDEFRSHPLEAGSAGFHDWDGDYEDVTLAGHEAEQKRLHAWLARFEAVNPAGLGLQDRDDREVLISKIKAALLEEETIQSWRHDPGQYSNMATEGVFQTVKRNYAPAADRMRFAISREQKIPAFLNAAKTVIDNPPRVFVDVALENIQGAFDFFRKSVPEAFKNVADPALQKQLADSTAAAVAALSDYQSWLKSTQPTAHGSFAIGAENFAKKLKYDEMVDLPLDQVLAMGEAQLRKDQAAFVVTARLIDPTKSADEVAASLAQDHPTAETLVPTARDQLIALRKFIVERKLAPLPPETMPTVTITPTFEQALIEAEEDSPGPYDTHATEAFYFITPPAPDLTPEQRKEYLEGFDIPVLDNISVHEVFPGHFTHLMDIRAMSGLSMVRKLAMVNSDVEGWAHYCETMMLDEGYGGGDPKLRLGQLQDALLRDVRYVAGIKMHTQGMTVDEATRMFIKEGRQAPPIARKEALRGTSNPTYLYYTLGKLEILKLREDWKNQQGDRYTIGEFHKRFIGSGTVPIKIIRREMMGSDGPLL